MTLTFDPIDTKIESNGPRIITNHPTKFHAIRFNTFCIMSVTRIQINGDQNITFRIFNAKVINQPSISSAKLIRRYFTLSIGCMYMLHKLKLPSPS